MILRLLVATSLLFTLNYLTHDWLGPSALWWEVTSAFLLALVGVGAIEVQKAMQEQQRVTGLTRELLLLQDALRGLDIEDFSTFFAIATSEVQADAAKISAGVPMVLGASPPMRRFWERLHRARWAQALPVGGIVGGSFTEKGRAGLPLLIRPVLREWQELGQMLERITEGEPAGRA